MTNIKQRVLYISEYKAIKKDKFFKDLGFSYANFKGIQKESALSSNSVDKILSKYPDVSAEWLVTGKGEMIKKEDDEEKIIEIESNPKDQYIIELQRDKIKSLENEIERIKKANKPQPGYQHAAEPE